MTSSQTREKQKKLTDDTGDAVKTFSLPVGTFHGIGFLEVHPFGDPAFRAVGERRGFYKPATDSEFPAVDAEPAVLSWLFFIRKTLYRAHGNRQDAIFIRSHNNLLLHSADIFVLPITI